MKNRNGKKEKMPANRSKNPGSSLTAGVATAVPATRPGTPTRAANPFAGTKPGGPATDHTEGARLAQEAIRKDPSVPENYAALAGALRMLAQFLRTRNPEGADNLVNMACAAAWEAKRRSTPALISGRTKQEVKILSAWLRTKNHLTPEASDNMMEKIHSEYLSKAIDGSTPLPLITGMP